MRNIILLALLAIASAERLHIAFDKDVLKPFSLANKVATLERTGKPSFKPTRSPVNSPSQAPSGAPTYSSGWVVENLVTVGGCDSNPSSVFAIRTGKCLKSYAEGDEEPYYVLAMCYTG